MILRAPYGRRNTLPYDPNELLTLADQLRLLMDQGIAEDDAKVRLGKLFAFRGQIIYSPKFAYSYEDAIIDWKTGRVVLRKWLRRETTPRRLPLQPRQWFTPTLTAAAHHTLFPPAGDSRRLTSGAEAETFNWLVVLMKAGDPTQSKARYYEEAKRKFSVGKRAFGRAWAKAIEASRNTKWSQAGPRKSSR
jgi:hypothetical protein